MAYENRVIEWMCDKEGQMVRHGEVRMTSVVYYFWDASCFFKMKSTFHELNMDRISRVSGILVFSNKPLLDIF